MMDKKVKKKSFIFNVEWQEILLAYPAEVRLEVYDAIVEYVVSGTFSELKPMAKMAFSFIKKEIDYNTNKYDEIVAKRSEAGKKAMEKRYNKKSGNLTNGNKSNKCNQMVANLTDNDNDNDNDNVSDKSDINKTSTNVDSKEKIDLPFVADDFKDVFSEWLAYKKGRKESYKTNPSIQACYKKLLKLSNNSADTAKIVVEQSMANNWAGLFEIANSHSKPASEIGVVLNDNSQDKYDSPENKKWEGRWNR